jgi:hypothetical protein
MALHHKEAQEHPANVVFALMEDRDFRYSVIRPALAKDKEALCRLSTGKHQVKGFRNIAKAPIALILPTISEEANLSEELARRILEHLLSELQALRDAVAAKLVEAGYEIREHIFDDEGMVVWRVLSDDVATAQFEGAFLPDEDSNAVMLMSLLLGWFGSDKDDDDDDEATEEAEEKQD